MSSDSIFGSTVKHFAWLFCLLLVVACASSVVAARYEGPLPSSLQDQDNSRRTNKLEDTLKWLGTVVEGNTAEVGKRSGRFDSYKYEEYRSDGCWIGWRETHESSDSGKFLSNEIRELRIPLDNLSRGSVRVDKIGASAFVVSFTTSKRKEAIVHREKTTYADGSADESFGLATGGGIYFQDENVANRAAKAVVFGVSSCQKSNTSQKVNRTN